MKQIITLLQDCGIDPSTLACLDQEAVPIYHVLVPGETVLSHWQSLRAHVAHSGYWPVVLGDADDLQYHRRARSNKHAPLVTASLDYAITIDVPTWLQLQRLRQYGGDEVLLQRDLYGPWPDQIDAEYSFNIPYHEWPRTPRPVYLGLVPTTIDWHVPVILHFGAWVRSPSPAEHAAVLRYWDQIYGIELVGMSCDALEVSVKHPPQTNEQALGLAEEHYAYCPSRVEQGAITITNLAAYLLNAPIWNFYWV